MRLVGKLRRVLLTRLTWETAGGLPGLLLTMSDGGQPGRTALHGPSRLKQLVGAFRPFVVRHAMPERVSETPEDWPDGESQPLDESGVKVTPLALGLQARPEACLTSALPLDELEHEAAESSAKRRRTDAVVPPPADATQAAPTDAAPQVADETHRVIGADGSAAAGGSCSEATAARAKHEALLSPMGDATEPHPDAAPDPHHELFLPTALEGLTPPTLCWLLEMPPVPPKFDAAAAVALGVPSGPLRAELCNGRAVELADGTRVMPHQVLSGGSAGELILVADCPTVAHVALLSATSSYATGCQRRQQRRRPLVRAAGTIPPPTAAGDRGLLIS